ncbi:hypothetical protein pipiens_005950 [Culex pipiens pipiens]|uniref:DUF4806 domain-containing protein n=1 Tax=Culex pipiens pipiens TaxID=38569 RepID=A0ABD1DSN3_CULPP
MDGQSSTSGDRHRRDIVEGFKFPIADADTVERLEVAVRKSKQTRDEYVSLLHSLRSNNSTNNPEILSKVYSDVALYNYSVNRTRPGSSLKIVKVRSFAVDKNRSNPSPRLSWSLDTSQSETTLKDQTGANEIKSISYPIPDELTVELLEAAVRNDKDVWNKYVAFLRSIKPKDAEITAIFSKVFCDNALHNYNVNRSDRYRKKPMKTYAVFWDCMLEAWQEHGVEPVGLDSQLTRVMYLFNKRKLNRKYRVQSKTNEVNKTFVYPIADEVTVERLEAAVRKDKEAWNKYVAFLRSLKPKDADITVIFREVFTDEALLNYNVNGTKQHGKKRMKSMAIFWDCLLEAWKENGLEPTTLHIQLMRVIFLLNKRKQNHKYRQGKKSL